MKPTFKILLSGLCVLTCIACNKKHAAAEEGRETLSDSLIQSLHTVPASMSTLTHELKLNGYVSTNENKEANVYSLVSGIVTKVNAENGDYVTKGQPLATIQGIETAEISNQVSQAEKRVELARNNLAWQKELLAEKMTTRQDVMQAETEYKSALSDLATSRQLSGITGGKNGIYTIKAPISGHIIHKAVASGSEVRQDHSEMLFTIADLNEIWIIAHVFESDIQKIHPGNPVRIHTLAESDKSFTGRIDKIYNVLDPQTKTMKVRINVKNTSGELLPGMYASVVIMEKDSAMWVSIPSKAIVMHDSKQYVILKDGNSLRPREVRVLKRINGQSFVENVRENEIVVTENVLFLFESLTRMQ